MPHLQKGAKMLGKKALQTGDDVAQDVLAGENVKTATKKLAKQALDLPRILPSQVQKRKPNQEKEQFISRQETENISAARETRRQIFLLEVKMAFVHHESQECTKSELDLFTIPATQKIGRAHV